MRITRMGVLIAAMIFVGVNASALGQREVAEMDVKILHCTSCGYVAQATLVATELRDLFGIETDLVPGFIGNFDVIVNGEILFSKTDTLRFPHEGEIGRLIGRRYRYDEVRETWMRRWLAPRTRN